MNIAIDFYKQDFLIGIFFRIMVRHDIYNPIVINGVFYRFKANIAALLKSGIFLFTPFDSFCFQCTKPKK